MAISTAVPVSSVARTVGIQTIFKDLRAGRLQNLPQRIAVVGQGSTASTYSTTKAQVTSAKEVGDAYGYGSPLHLVAQQLFPVNGNGVGTIPVTVYPLDDDGSGVVADGDITPSGAASAINAFKIVVNGIESESFVTAVSDTVAQIVAKMVVAVNAVIDMPIIAVDNTTDMTFTSKWKGVSANAIYVAVTGVTTDVTYSITQANGGLVNPDVDDSLAQVGDVWETLFINCMELGDTTSLGKYDTFGEGRWGALTRKPCIVFTGNNEATLATAIAVPDARPTDRTNSAINCPGSINLPFVICAAAVANIARRADDNPPRDYGSMDMPTLTPGTDAEQWTYIQRDSAVKAGASTIEIKDLIINISDTVTFYHPAGESVPAYRYVVDIIKLMQVLYNLDLIFNTPEWDGAPLIPDDQPTSNRSAKKPKMAVADMSALTDSLALNAIISDAGFTKDNTLAQISETNPKRLDCVYPVKLSGNANIISIDLEFGFYFGTPVVVN